MKNKVYCINAQCPFKDCESHLQHLKHCNATQNDVKVSNLDGVCRRYISWLVCEAEREINNGK